MGRLQWLAQREWDDGFFKIPREPVVTPTSKPTGRVTSAVPFGMSTPGLNKTGH